MTIKSSSKEDLIGACGEAIKAMKHIRNELREIGLDHYAEVLQRAETKLCNNSLYFFDDTEPMTIM
jgi:hypothetical protein